VRFLGGLPTSNVPLCIPGTVNNRMSRPRDSPLLHWPSLTCILFSMRRSCSSSLPARLGQFPVHVFSLSVQEHARLHFPPSSSRSDRDCLASWLMQNCVSPPGIPRLVQTMGGWLHRGYGRETSIAMFHLSYYSCIREATNWNPSWRTFFQAFEAVRCSCGQLSFNGLCKGHGMERTTRMKVKVRGRTGRQLERLVEQPLRPTRQDRTKDLPG
jgi:hypothetical protein